MELSTSQQKKVQSIVAIGLASILLVAFLESGIREEVSLENLRSLGENPWTPVLIVAAMTGAWAFALPASVFFFITPLLFPAIEATVIICVGSAFGTAMGYVVARFVGGPWVERIRGYRVTSFLERHSSFANFFAIRVFPSSPHGWINYAAGLLALPFWKFLTATMLGVSIKAFLYSTAIEGSVGASSISEALNWQTVTALSTLGILAVVGHIVRRKWRG
ncbi:MAG TPA: VTT domain-containing protein [Bacteroidota bacterium]|nr:VTT domain-containing protein [Bacteroidota bacterium]